MVKLIHVLLCVVLRPSPLIHIPRHLFRFRVDRRRQRGPQARHSCKDAHKGMAAAALAAAWSRPFDLDDGEGRVK